MAHVLKEDPIDAPLAPVLGLATVTTLIIADNLLMQFGLIMAPRSSGPWRTHRPPTLCDTPVDGGKLWHS